MEVFMNIKGKDQRKKEASRILQSKTMLKNYLNVVESSNILKKINIPKYQSNASLQETLESSRLLFRQQFQPCHQVLVKLIESIVSIEEEICIDQDRIDQSYSSYKKHWQPVFKGFASTIGDLFAYIQNNFIESFEQKIKRMDNFYICLFGRTKVGKSTTMEALTSGDGKSIGVGFQNTTQDSKEYHWNNLVIIDTPGIDAMDDAGNLEAKALQYADSSDLIMFLLPHQIQESDFDKFSRFYYKQYKPIIFILNIKKEVGAIGSTTFDMFIKYPEDVIREADLSGYKTRISNFLFNKEGIDESLIPIIPIHSHAAYLSRKMADKNLSQKLFEISRFQKLEDHIVSEIKNFGELYRIKNPYDSVLLFSQQAINKFQELIDVLKKQKVFYIDTANKFTKVKSNIEIKRHSLFDEIFHQYFEGKRGRANQFVDQIVNAKKDEKKLKKILENILPKNEQEEKTKAFASQMQVVINKEIENYLNKFAQDLNHINLSFQSVYTSSRNHMNGVTSTDSIGTTMSNISFGSSAILGIGTAIVMTDTVLTGVAGTLFGIGSADIWNPVGWVLLGLSAILGLLGWFFKSKAKKKLEEAKQKIRQKIIKKLHKTENRIESELNQAVKSIVDDISQNHVAVLREYADHIDKYLNQQKKLSAELRAANHLMSRLKFQAMLRRLIGIESIDVINVEESPNTIVLSTQSPNLKQTAKIEKILSRVEEKNVTIRII